jgi:DNA polymerase III epsilon subunit-like protein
MREFILFDTETTGASENDRICQLAFARLNTKQTEWVAEFCNPTIPITFHAMAVHGITNEMVKDLPTFNQTNAAKRFSELNTNENVLVAHNAKFDIDMAAKEGVMWQGEIIDTLRCAKHLLPDEESHALQYLRYSLGLYLDETNDEMQELRATYPDMMAAHNALFDIAILKILLKRLSTLAGNSANALIGLTKKPILIKKLRFGKYKDALLEDIAKKDANYLEWLLREKKDDEDLAYSIRVVLGVL